MENAASEFGFESFASHAFYHAINRSLVERALRALPARPFDQPLTILDMGCGTGLITTILAEVLTSRGRKSNIVAVDPDERSVLVARARAQGLTIPVRWVRGSTSQLPAIISNVDIAFFCNAIHLLSDKASAIKQICTVLAPGGLLACNTGFVYGTYVEGTEQFYRLWTRRALGWLKRKHPDVHLTREKKPMAMRWLRPDEYVALFQEAGLSVQPEVEAADIPLDAWRDLGRYRLFIEGALPGAPLDLGAAALEAAVYEVGEELGIAQVPRRWLQLVGKKADSASSSNGIDRARTGGT